MDEQTPKTSRGNFASDPPFLCFAQNRRADRGELKPDPDVVQKTGGLLRSGPALGSSGHKISELGSGQPKRVLHGSIASLLWPFANDVDDIVSFDSLIAKSRDIVFRRMLMRVNDQPVYFSYGLFAEFGNPHASQVQPRAHPVGADDSAQ